MHAAHLYTWETRFWRDKTSKRTAILLYIVYLAVLIRLIHSKQNLYNELKVQEIIYKFEWSYPHVFEIMSCIVIYTPSGGKVMIEVA